MKRFISFILALVICLSVSVFAFADELMPEEDAGIVTLAAKPGDSTQAEETCWYFREVNGRVQMRQWSITYRKWLTDWIDVGPAL